jgi:hypothetical protein
VWRSARWKLAPNFAQSMNPFEALGALWRQGMCVIGYAWAGVRVVFAVYHPPVVAPEAAL